MGKFVREVHALLWTLAGTGLVLITLSGHTRRLGIWITAIAVAAHFAGVLLLEDEDEQAND